MTRVPETRSIPNDVYCSILNCFEVGFINKCVLGASDVVRETDCTARDLQWTDGNLIITGAGNNGKFWEKRLLCFDCLSVYASLNARDASLERRAFGESNFIGVVCVIWRIFRIGRLLRVNDTHTAA
jgi:hypothetical protein